MKKTFTSFLSLTICAVMLCGSALALSSDEATSRRPGPVGVWGAATHLEDGSIHLQNSNENDPYQEIILHISEETALIDAVSGQALDPATIQDGATVYAWTEPAMTLSLPPQATAKVLVANIPADFAVPEYYIVGALKPQPMPAIDPPPALSFVELITEDGKELKITSEASLLPYLTKNIVHLEDLHPGTSILVWTDSNQVITRVVLLPYAYQGTISWNEDGRVCVNGTCLPVSGKLVDGKMLLPLRSSAETLGLQVEWVSGKGAVVSRNGSIVLTAMPGGSVALGNGSEIAADCLIDQGTTYLEADALALGLELYHILQG